MAADSRNEKVIKLVHRGGFVEIHRKPIKAAEVMQKNPRHCVTRPDVFKFPWIVVHPESVLKPGSVFYIVPNHTIHRLSQKNRCSRYQAAVLQEEEDFLAVESAYRNQCPDMAQKRAKVDCKYEDWHNGVFPKCLLDTNLNSYKSDIDVRTRSSCDSIGTTAGISGTTRSEEDRRLKSCLKKNNVIQSRSSKVRFAVSDEDDDKIRVEVFEFQQEETP